MIRTRTKSVCIRVSEEELRILREACERTGSRNVSELAREAMHMIVTAQQSAPLSDQDLKFWLRELSGRLASLQTEVERLSALPAVHG